MWCLVCSSGSYPSGAVLRSDGSRSKTPLELTLAPEQPMPAPLYTSSARERHQPPQSEPHVRSGDAYPTDIMHLCAPLPTSRCVHPGRWQPEQARDGRVSMRLAAAGVRSW